MYKLPFTDVHVAQTWHWYRYRYRCLFLALLCLVCGVCAATGADPGSGSGSIPLALAPACSTPYGVLKWPIHAAIFDGCQFYGDCNAPQIYEYWWDEQLLHIQTFNGPHPKWTIYLVNNIPGIRLRPGAGVPPAATVLFTSTPFCRSHTLSIRATAFARPTRILLSAPSISQIEVTFYYRPEELAPYLDNYAVVPEPYTLLPKYDPAQPHTLVDLQTIQAAMDPYYSTRQTSSNYNLDRQTTEPTWHILTSSHKITFEEPTLCPWLMNFAAPFDSFIYPEGHAGVFIRPLYASLHMLDYVASLLHVRIYIISTLRPVNNSLPFAAQLSRHLVGAALDFGLQDIQTRTECYRKDCMMCLYKYELEQKEDHCYNDSKTKLRTCCSITWPKSAYPNSFRSFIHALRDPRVTPYWRYAPTDSDPKYKLDYNHLDLKSLNNAGVNLLLGSGTGTQYRMIEQQRALCAGLCPHLQYTHREVERSKMCESNEIRAMNVKNNKKTQNTLRQQQQPAAARAHSVHQASIPNTAMTDDTDFPLESWLDSLSEIIRTSSPRPTRATDTDRDSDPEIELEAIMTVDPNNDLRNMDDLTLEIKDGITQLFRQDETGLKIPIMINSDPDPESPVSYIDQGDTILVLVTLSEERVARLDQLIRNNDPSLESLGITTYITGNEPQDTIQPPNGDTFGAAVEPGSGSDSDTSVGGVTGDPQFSGFHGQSFQFHGLPDEYFNLITTSDMILNAHFIYLSTGNCYYNDTECFTHPGTYMDIIGFMFGSTRVMIRAGSHASGLRVFVMDEEIHPSSDVKSISWSVSSHERSARMSFVDTRQVTIRTDMFHFEINNSDFFLNSKGNSSPLRLQYSSCAEKPSMQPSPHIMLVSLRSSALLLAGAPYHVVSSSSLCSSLEQGSTAAAHELESHLSHLYPLPAGVAPIRGLLGQTWRNAKICGKYWFGTPMDYLTDDLWTNNNNKMNQHIQHEHD